MDKKNIEHEAKAIMDKFMQAMKDIEVEEDFILEREVCFREEQDGKEVDEDFRQRFLANAPKTSSDAIIAKKGSWVE